MKVVLITGSREFPWRRSKEIADALEGCGLAIVGDARGADSVALKLAERACIPTLKCKADWNSLGRGAGPARNFTMVKFASIFDSAGHSVVCHAFPIGESPGTRGCMKLVKAIMVPIVVHEAEDVP